VAQTDPDDQDLVEAAKAGDRRAFQELYQRYERKVYAVAYGFLRNQEDALDVLQEAFIKVHRYLSNFEGQSSFYTWLYRITMNVAADRGRARGAQGRAFGTERVPEEDWERVLPDQDPGDESPDAAAARTEERAKIMKALDTLSEDHRRIVMLSDLEGLSYREIAETLDIPMGTVMSRLHNARKRLRDALGPLLLLLLVIGTTAALLAAPSLHAQTPHSGVVRFGSRVLVGTDGPLPAGLKPVGGEGDERMVAFMPKLRQLFRYKEYASIARYRAEVPVGTLQTWTIPGDRTLEVLPESVSGDTVRMRVRLTRGTVNEVVTNIQAARGNPAVLGGPKYENGVLIIIVWANANPERR
jgi:RNA polymerase sigma-70 factor (ECF subfamily)